VEVLAHWGLSSHEIKSYKCDRLKEGDASYSNDLFLSTIYSVVSKDKLAGTCKDNGSGSNAEKDDGRKTVHRTKKRKTSLEMDG
jgi:hypothetical protein